MRYDILNSKETILTMISEDTPKSVMCRFFNCKPETLNSYLKKMNIEYSGNQGLKGKKTDKKRKTAFEYSNKEIVKTPLLRKKLIQDGIKEDKCELCGISEWMGNKITLELHHVDGNRFNNKFENLQILCPNCHSLTPNHSKKKT